MNASGHNDRGREREDLDETVEGEDVGVINVVHRCFGILCLFMFYLCIDVLGVICLFVFWFVNMNYSHFSVGFPHLVALFLIVQPICFVLI